MSRQGIVSRARAEVDRLLALGIVQQDELRPCSEDDIVAIEQAHQVRLPEAYKVFLRAMGRGAGSFLASDHWSAFYAEVLTLDRSVREHLGQSLLPADWFCFATRMGEVYLFFSADGLVDDPPVRYWTEGSNPNVLPGFASFWDWFGDMVSDHA